MEQQALAQADDLMKKAQAKLNSFFLFRSEDTYSDAARLITQAAAQYKIAKDYKRAGEAYIQASDIYTSKTGDKLNNITCLVDAATVFKLCDATRAAKCYEGAAKLFMSSNRFSQAAKNWNDLGDLYENELFDRKSAINAYIQCAESFKLCNSKISSYGALTKAASLNASDHNYEGAIKLFEQLAELYAQESSASMHHNVNKNCYNALICSMAHEAAAKPIELTKTAEKLQHYEELYPTFDGHDDANLIRELLDAYKESDPKKYSQSLHNRKYKLDSWSMDLFYKVKKSMEGTYIGVDENGDRTGSRLNLEDVNTDMANPDVEQHDFT